MNNRYLQDCKMGLVKSGLIQTLPKCSLRVLLVYLAIAKWRNGTFETGHKGTATMSGLNARDVRKGVNELLRLGIIERLHKGVSSADRSLYKFNLERIEQYGLERNNAIQNERCSKLRNFGWDVEIPC